MISTCKSLIRQSKGRPMSHMGLCGPHCEKNDQNEIQGGPSQMLFKESIHLSFCSEYSYSENCSEKILIAVFVCKRLEEANSWLY